MFSLLLVANMLLAQTPGPDGSVEAGRDALSQWGRYPWYDSESDGLQPVVIVEPKDMSGLFDWLDFNWGPWNFSAGWIAWLFWTVIFVVLVALAWLLIRSFMKRNKKVDEVLPPPGESPEEQKRRIEALPEPVRERTRLLEAAQKCYLEGNFNEAVIYLFSHQLVCLDKNYLIRLARGKTNRQYLRELGPRETLKRILADTTVAFEDVFFGGLSLDRQRFERCWSRLREFEALATGGAQ